MLSALIAVVLSAESGEVIDELEAPARGSVHGWWALVDASFLSSSDLTSTFPGGSSAVAGELAVVGGTGFELGKVRLSPTVKFSIGPYRHFGFPDFLAVQWSSLDFALALPDLIEDHQVTGLRFTPIVAASFPLRPGAFVGESSLTTISVGGQLERRFGSLELAYRPMGSTVRCLAAGGCNTWLLSNRVFAENWFTKSLSIAVGLTWLTRWFESLAIGPLHAITEETLVTWAFSERFGATFAFGVTHQLASAVPSTTSLQGSLTLWFRTDPVLQRNWLDR